MTRADVRSLPRVQNDKARHMVDGLLPKNPPRNLMKNTNLARVDTVLQQQSTPSSPADTTTNARWDYTHILFKSVWVLAHTRFIWNSYLMLLYCNDWASLYKVQRQYSGEYLKIGERVIKPAEQDPMSWLTSFVTESMSREVAYLFATYMIPMLGLQWCGNLFGFMFQSFAWPTWFQTVILAMPHASSEKNSIVFIGTQVLLGFFVLAIGAEVISASTHSAVQMLKLLARILWELICKFVDCTLCWFAVGSFYKACAPQISFCRDVHDEQITKPLEELEEEEVQLNRMNSNESRIMWTKVKSCVAVGSLFVGEGFIFENGKPVHQVVYFLGINGRACEIADSPATRLYREVCNKLYTSMQTCPYMWESRNFNELERSLDLDKEDLRTFYEVYEELNHRLEFGEVDNKDFLIFPSLTAFVQERMDEIPTPVESRNCDTKIKYNRQNIRRRTCLRACVVCVLIALMVCLFLWPIDDSVEIHDDWVDAKREESNHEDSQCDKIKIENGFRKKYICEKVPAKKVLVATHNCYQHRTTYALAKCGGQVLWQMLIGDGPTHNIENALNAMVKEFSHVVKAVSQLPTKLGKYVLTQVRQLNVKLKPNDDVSCWFTLFFLAIYAVFYYLVFFIGSIPEFEELEPEPEPEPEPEL